VTYSIQSKQNSKVINTYSAPMVCGIYAVGLELPCDLLDYLRYIVPGQQNCRITVVDSPSAADDCLCRPGFYRVQTRIGMLTLPRKLWWHTTSNNNKILTLQKQTIKQSPYHEFVTFLCADSYHACAMFIYQLLPPSFHCYVCTTDTDSTPQIVVITILTILLSRPINLV